MDVSGLIGTPFKYGGRGEGYFDCYGLVMALYAQRGITLPDYVSPTDRGVIAALMASEVRLWRRVDTPQKGDVVLLRVRGLLCHVGVFLGENRFVHTMETTGGVCIERLSEWRKLIEGYYRYAGD